MIWLVLAYFFHTTGELCISPVGLSMVTKLAPLRLGSLMMGVWFLVNFVGNTLAGYIGAFTEHMGEYDWMISLAADFGVRAEHAGLLGVFGGLAVTLLAVQLRRCGPSPGASCAGCTARRKSRHEEADEPHRRSLPPRLPARRLRRGRRHAAPKETADEFVARANRELAESGRGIRAGRLGPATYITPDTEVLTAKANERYLGVVAQG